MSGHCIFVAVGDQRNLSSSATASGRRSRCATHLKPTKYFCLSWLLISGMVFSATAQPYVDDEFSGSPNFGYELDYPGDYLIQTFTVYHNGPLVSVGVQISQDFLVKTLAPPVDDLHLRLVRTDSQGVPLINDVLATQTIDRGSVPLSYSSTAFSTVDLSSSNVYVHAGDVIGIAVTSDQADYSDPYPSAHYHYIWHGLTDDPHPGGGFYVYSPIVFGPAPFLLGHRDPPIEADDMGYRVILNTPEPASILLLAIALTSFGMFRLFRQLRRVVNDHNLPLRNE